MSDEAIEGQEKEALLAQELGGSLATVLEQKVYPDQTEKVAARQARLAKLTSGIIEAGPDRVRQALKRELGQVIDRNIEGFKGMKNGFHRELKTLPEEEKKEIRIRRADGFSHSIGNFWTKEIDLFASINDGRIHAIIEAMGFVEAIKAQTMTGTPGPKE